MRQTFTNGKFDLAGRPSAPKKAGGSPGAEAVAVEAFVYLSGDEDRLLRFLNLSGLQVDDLRGAAGAPGFLASVLDYLCGDEKLASSFAKERGLSPEALITARRALAGGTTET